MFDIGLEFSFDDNPIDSNECSSAALPDHPDYVELFFNAVHLGQHEILKELLTVPISNINILDEKGMTALGIAAQNGHVNIALLLLQHRANVNTRNKDDKTPLLIALENNHFRLANILFENNADPNLADNAHNTPLSFALYNYSARTSMLEALLKNGADPNQVLQTGVYRGNTPLAAAVDIGDYRLISVLCQYGAEFNNTDKNQKLFETISLEYLDITKKIWPKLSSDDKVAVIISSVLNNQIHSLKYALNNVTPDIRQKAFHTLIEGVTPLSYCFSQNRLRCARLLLAFGHDLLEKGNVASKEVIVFRFGNKDWHKLLEEYFTNMKKHEKTFSLTEFAANRVYDIAQTTQTPLNDLRLPPELEALCQTAPLRFKQQSTLKPRHVRDFLSELFKASESQIAEQRKEICDKRSKKKRAV